MKPNFVVVVPELHNGIYIRYENTLFGNYFLKFYIVKIVLISPTCFSEYMICLTVIKIDHEKVFFSEPSMSQIRIFEVLLYLYNMYHCASHAMKLKFVCLLTCCYIYHLALMTANGLE